MSPASWHSVHPSDGIPTDQGLLVYDPKSRNVFTAWWTGTRWMAWTPHDDYRLLGIEPSHWMHMPSPPEVSP